LFIGGPARSGTTALALTLNQDRRFAVGIERFLDYERLPVAEDFVPGVFFAPRKPRGRAPGSRLYPPRVELPRLRHRYDQGQLEYIGDKVPVYVRHLDELAAEFPGARFLVTCREPAGVANSFQARADDPEDGWPERNDWERGLRDWHTALEFCRAFEAGGRGDRLHLVDYDGFFSGQKPHVLALFRFLGLEPNTRLIKVLRRSWEQFPRRDRALSDDELAELESRVDRELAGWAEQRIAASLRPERAGSEARA
jgi:hypothetical protein